MIHKSITFLLLSASLLSACNSDTSTSVEEKSDASVQGAGEQPAESSFDYSKGVTAISPNLYRSLSDTLGIRIVEGIYQPGDSSIMHAHPDFALYVLEGSMVELTAADGVKQNVDFKTGMAVVMPGTAHSAKNIGKGPLRLIAVEVNRPR